MKDEEGLQDERDDSLGMTEGVQGMTEDVHDEGRAGEAVHCDVRWVHDDEAGNEGRGGCTW